MSKKLQLVLGFLMVVFLTMLSAPSWATDWDDCDHPRFLEKGCGYEGTDGADGADGADGVDGTDGADGIDGVDGRDGRDGVDGEVPTEWLIETRHWYKEIREAAAATAAMQVHLPQDQKSRLTASMSSVAGSTGVGLGYAYMFDNERNSALTVAVGFAGSETAIAGSFGFEFGGKRRFEIPVAAIAPKAAPPDPIPAGSVVITESEYDDLLVAQVAQEDFEEHAEQTEYRYAQQQSLIEALQEEVDDFESEADEIERIKREQAVLKAAEEERAKRRAAVRDGIARKRAAKAEEKDDG